MITAHDINSSEEVAIDPSMVEMLYSMGREGTSVRFVSGQRIQVKEKFAALKEEVEAGKARQ